MYTMVTMAEERRRRRWPGQRAGKRGDATARVNNHFAPARENYPCGRNGQEIFSSFRLLVDILLRKAFCRKCVNRPIGFLDGIGVSRPSPTASTDNFRLMMLLGLHNGSPAHAHMPLHFRSIRYLRAFQMIETIFFENFFEGSRAALHAPLRRLMTAGRLRLARAEWRAEMSQLAESKAPDECVLVLRACTVRSYVNLKKYPRILQGITKILSSRTSKSNRYHSTHEWIPLLEGEVGGSRNSVLTSRAPRVVNM
ncbi:unnamed protein product [Nesidiocoris tenuis]|uniref:Uncharacterized protein n=1 Tax=Nesidiocoris tenuis TaxID=355587 RepID=A0A6H5H7R1_9HEMI|nr:unnamed protein product [Nesidiocoris tenuis]